MNGLFYQNAPVIIILIFMLIPLVIGSFAFRNSILTINDFFLCRRSMGTVTSFFTVYATWWSSFAFLGSISYFYSVGSVYWTGIAWNVLFGILYMIFGLKISPYARDRNYVTPVSFFSDIYGSRALNIIVIIVMIAFSVSYLQIQLYGGAIIIEIATRGLIPWRICALLFYAVMIIYLWTGGLRAVAWADIFYGILIFFGLLAGGMIISDCAGGVDNFFSTIINERPDLILLSNDSFAPGISMWISMFIILPIGEIMSPPMWTRIYATKTKKTFYLMPFLLTFVTIGYLGSMLAGSAAVVLQPEAPPYTDAILPMLLISYVPGWIMAIIMCCGAAACLSTANAEIHSVSSLITIDIYAKYIRPNATEKHIVFTGKVIIVAFSAFAYLALVLNKFPDSIVGTGFMALSGLAQIAVPVLGAFVWKKSNAAGAIFGLIVGVGFTLIFSFWQSASLPLSPGVIGLCLNAGVFVLCGILLPKGGAIKETLKKEVLKDEISDKNESKRRLIIALWICIALCFCSVEFPGIFFINRIDPTIFGLPFIYGFPLIIWGVFCILTFVGYKLRWGNEEL